jgi:ArsR family transcriptional regulator, arsenate/arsenite/antimonite-responsive transcriptional repressor
MPKSKSLSLVEIPVIGVDADRRSACAIIEPRMESAEAARLSIVFKALGNPVRLQMLDFISQGGGRLCACDMERHFDLTQPTISHHLKILRDAGLIVSESSGVWVFHRISKPLEESLQRVIDLMRVSQSAESSNCG